MGVRKDVNEDVQVDDGAVVADHNHIFDFLEGIPEQIWELRLLPLFLPLPFSSAPHFKIIVLAIH